MATMFSNFDVQHNYLPTDEMSKHNRRNVSS